MIAVVMVTYIYRAAANVGNVDNRHVTQVIGFFLILFDRSSLGSCLLTC